MEVTLQALVSSTVSTDAQQKFQDLTVAALSASVVDASTLVNHTASIPTSFQMRSSASAASSSSQPVNTVVIAVALGSAVVVIIATALTAYWCWAQQPELLLVRELGNFQVPTTGGTLGEDNGVPMTPAAVMTTQPETSETSTQAERQDTPDKPPPYPVPPVNAQNNQRWCT